MIDIDGVAQALHETSVEKGFYDSLDMTEFNSQAKQLAMIHSEVTEVLEVLRKDKGEEQLLDELADILIRLLDFYAALREVKVIENISLEDALFAKMSVNTNRPKMHGVRG